ncbi:Aste57867_19757 [Aphanomyces stellatus]|uniref:Aste57867_19757 protein n=1 Tax=Aphanomyces stellatus TaxID=120398 RepID=A0A485LF61_9STRA|nr:hypothetical protein As57867_019692 [Aphanomyces stellatus]VFT96455.1 Aste57867_19757 [Aphanomyces stellatus]
MQKVHALVVATDDALPRPIQPTRPRIARTNKLSVLYSIVFSASIVTEPLKAYVSEPLPWQLVSMTHNTSTLSFEDYVNTTATYLATKYNTHTLSPSTVFSHDKVTNSALLRYTMALPSNADESCTTHVIYFPGSIFYGFGTVEFVCQFLAQNASTQLTNLKAMCQHNRMAGLLFSESCTWFESSGTRGTFWVYHAVQIVESIMWSWAKLGFRCALSCFIGIQLWQLYFCHYGPLLKNLCTIGLNHADGRVYEVDVGDPTWLILSHPIVCIAMVVDIHYSMAYFAIAGYRVCQMHDLWQFAVGSFAGSNMVWASYTTMRFSSLLIKNLQWEKYFAPVDPGLMALTAALYAGPLFYIICQTPIVLLFEYLIQVCVPGSAKRESLEVLPGMLSFLLMFASVPLMTAYLQNCFLRRRE